ncbi:MAG TPA: VOC family protein [Acidimicrobiales bacterium]|nr:VOC family protein [Acidimicrobiales bacterium]
MAGTAHTNSEFELRGFNHLALVARDMAETVAWYEDVLGMKLVKTLELPGGRGQHFFLDMGNGVDGIAFFWFPGAPEGVPGESLQDRRGMTAIGTMNHLAFDVPREKFDEYAAKLRSKGVELTMIINHADSLDGGHKVEFDPDTDDGDVFVRSMYFRDPNGTLLEFACWMRPFTEADVKHAPAITRVEASAS